VARERIEKTLIILDEAEVRQVLLLARENNPAHILHFVSQVIAKKVEAALRKRCK
jgi:flagellar biosynthesis/type III secretory pathway protein FliH